MEYCAGMNEAVRARKYSIDESWISGKIINKKNGESEKIDVRKTTERREKHHNTDGNSDAAHTRHGRI